VEKNVNNQIDEINPKNLKKVEKKKFREKMTVKKKANFHHTPIFDISKHPLI